MKSRPLTPPPPTPPPLPPTPPPTPTPGGHHAELSAALHHLVVVEKQPGENPLVRALRLHLTRRSAHAEYTDAVEDTDDADRRRRRLLDAFTGCPLSYSHPH